MSYVVCPEKITGPAPTGYEHLGLVANMPCGCRVPIVTPAAVMDCQCPRGHRFFASLDQVLDR